jgi:hypothetical protein
MNSENYSNTSRLLPVNSENEDSKDSVCFGLGSLCRHSGILSSKWFSYYP